jgi:hypothetical protein
MADPIPLYRFLDSHGALKTLEAGRFRVGLVSNFNDPFEWRLGCTGTATPDQQKSVESSTVNASVGQKRGWGFYALATLSLHLFFGPFMPTNTVVLRSR